VELIVLLELFHKKPDSDRYHYTYMSYMPNSLQLI